MSFFHSEGFSFSISYILLSFGICVGICCVVWSTLDQKHHIGKPNKVKGFLFFWLSLGSK